MKFSLSGIFEVIVWFNVDCIENGDFLWDKMLVADK
jgi:hypothetical protein